MAAETGEEVATVRGAPFVNPPLLTACVTAVSVVVADVVDDASFAASGLALPLSGSVCCSRSDCE